MKLNKKNIRLILADQEREENELHKAILKLPKITDRTMIGAGFAKGVKEAEYIMLRMEIKFHGFYAVFHDGVFFCRKGEITNFCHQKGL